MSKVKVSKSARRLEVSSGVYHLTHDADQPWRVQLRAGTGAPVADLFVLASIDTGAGLDLLEPPAAPTLEREGDDPAVVFEGRSSAWDHKRCVFICREAELEYRVSVRGEGAVTTCRLGQGYVAADLRRLQLGANGFRAGYTRPFRDFARGSRPHFRAVYTACPSAAEHDLRQPWEDAVIDLIDDPCRDGGHDSFLPALWAVAWELGDDQPWVTAGLAPTADQLGFHRFAYRGGETFGFEVDYGGSLHVAGDWTTPGLVLRFGGRDWAASWRGVVEGLEGREAVRLTPRATPRWWRRPVFDGQGEQRALAGIVAGDGQVAAECSLANYLDALALLKAHGVSPGTLWIGEGWWREDQPGVPDPLRWPDLGGFIARQHREDRRVVLTWPLFTAAHTPEAVPNPHDLDYRTWLEEQVRTLLSPDGYDADGLRIPGLTADQAELPARLGGTQWMYYLLALLWEAAKGAKSDALVIAPTVNPYFARVVDMVPLGGLWTDRTTVEAALQQRAALAKLSLPTALLAVGDWGVPGHAAWREAVALGPKLGVPVLSHATALPSSRETLDEEDFAFVARQWRSMTREDGDG